MPGSREAAFPPEAPRSWARPLTDRVFARTEARRARGEYLANALLQCALCHSPRDWGSPGAPPVAARLFAGAVLRDDSLARLVAPNLTPDAKTGAGRWSDDMFARAIREGVGHDGRALHPQMWYETFRFLCDEDLASVVVYLRSLRPVVNALPLTRLTAERRRKIEGDLRPLVAVVPEPDRSTPEARGRYLMSMADCAGCHTSWYSSRMPGLLGGGNLVEHDTLAAWSSNISPDSSGLGAYDPETFRLLIRTGKGGILHPIMPWVVFARLTDADLSDMFTFLKTLAPVRHYIDNHSPPTACAVCGQVHGMGAMNAIVKPKPVPVPRAVLAGYEGQYRSEAFGFSRVVTLRGSRLFGSEDGGENVELIAQSPTRFAAPGWLAPVEFVPGPDGRAREMISVEVDDVRLARVR